MPTTQPATILAQDPPAAAELAGRLTLVRERQPRVHCLTNPVAMTLSANLLLAAGAVPSMTAEVAAQADFLRGSDALVVNLGMLDHARLEAIGAATALAAELGRPWALDPVKVDRSLDRLDVARRLIEAKPAVVRANEAEAAALVRGGRRRAAHLAGEFGCVVAVTGPADLVTDGRRSLEIRNGSPLMDRVTGMGCAVSALLGAFLAVEPDAYLATAAALLVAGVAGEIAAETARGPGSFVPAFLDAVYTLDAATLAERARLA
ncbi:MAG TPA: hydroxyethylthiazole kinase [Geminicoccaceae bacterium]